jgi:UDP-3-O-acyl N-acetylglucosamine deacetylase
MMISNSSTTSNITYKGHGITSKQAVAVEVEQREAGYGIVFALKQDGQITELPAHHANVVNTLRNVVLGKDKARLCIVEHFLAAAAVWGLEDLYVTVDGPEMPLGDGSANFWIELFKQGGWQQRPIVPNVELTQPVSCSLGDRTLLAVPAESFSATYMMDWNHPMIGKRWYTWTAQTPVEDIALARTFGSQKEHDMLGLSNEVVSMTPDDFSKPLRWPDEPVRHKVLDLIGDLYLSGCNPLRWKAHFISMKGGHQLDVKLAGLLAEQRK